MDHHEQPVDSSPADDDEGTGSKPSEANPTTDPTPASLVDGEEKAVDPRSVKVARIFGLSLTLLIATIPLVVFTAGRVFGNMPGRVYLVLLGVLFLLLAFFLSFSYAWPAARHRHLRYCVDKGGLRIRRGVFWRKMICISITRVQHTDVAQGPLHRPFELATLTVHTAGTEGASISLAGLEHGVAMRLRDHLRPDPTPDAG